ncbi:MAG: hypothetical protein SGPRY_007692 [Prymnesium sp.]
MQTYWIDPKKKSWAHWDERLPVTFRISPDTPFFKILVPTVDTTRYAFLMGTMVRAEKHVLITGDVGVGKTSIVSSCLGSLDDGFVSAAINFSAQTSSVRVSDSIESRVEKRTKDTFAPPGGKKLVIFIDDFNMPEKEIFGAQPPLEILRQWMQYGFWYDLKKQSARYIRDAQLVAAMGHPGGGRTQISARVLHWFHVLNMSFPDRSQLTRIFGTFIHSHLASTGDAMTAATIELYNKLSADLLPTPDKPHYTFNMRDISRVFQGVLQSRKNYYDSRDGMIRLWVHESCRVFADRLTNVADRTYFQGVISDNLAMVFQTSFKHLYKDGLIRPFGDFMRDVPEGKPPAYEELADSRALKTYIEDKLDEYNLEGGVQPMGLVMFSDAIGYVCRIKRIISMPRGHAMLVGVGGSGRQSLSRLATYIAEFKLFTARPLSHASMRIPLHSRSLRSLPPSPTVYLPLSLPPSPPSPPVPPSLDALH